MQAALLMNYEIADSVDLHCLRFTKFGKAVTLASTRLYVTSAPFVLNTKSRSQILEIVPISLLSR